ncbi:MAG: YihY/virulence factor BrkB family protein [Chloroflexi bacterium]|nr:YihY/virulence factor BrkB family protein [Chloroflexota bacterium]
MKQRGFRRRVGGLARAARSLSRSIADTARRAQDHVGGTAESITRATMAWIEATPQLRVLYLTADRFGTQQLPTFAAAISFQTFISLFPLIGFITAIAAFLVEPEVMVQFVADQSGDLAPGAEDFLESTLPSMAAVRESVGVISLIALLWTGSNLFGALRRGLDAATGATRRRTFVQGRALDLATTMATGGLLALSVTATAVLTFLQQSELLGGDSPFAWLGWLLRWLGVLLPILFATGVFGLMYHLVPAERLAWRPALAGGLVGAVGFEIGKNAFVWYTANFGSFNAIYGPIATVVLLLIWIYFSSMIFLAGAAFGSAVSAAMGPGEPPGPGAAA